MSPTQLHKSSEQTRTSSRRHKTCSLSPHTLHVSGCRAYRSSTWIRHSFVDSMHTAPRNHLVTRFHAFASLRVSAPWAPQLPSLCRKHQESTRRQVPPSPSPDRLATRLHAFMSQCSKDQPMREHPWSQGVTHIVFQHGLGTVLLIVDSTHTAPRDHLVTRFHAFASLRVSAPWAPQLPSLRRKHQESARRQVPPSPSPDCLATRLHAFMSQCSKDQLMREHPWSQDVAHIVFQHGLGTVLLILKLGQNC
jgi:hypothetical protein